MKFGCFLNEASAGKYDYSLEIKKDGRLSFNHPILGKSNIERKPNPEGVAAIASLTHAARSLIKEYGGRADILSFRESMECIDQEYVVWGGKREKGYRLVHCGAMEGAKGGSHFSSSLTLYDASEKQIFNMYARSDKDGFSHCSERHKELPDYISTAFEEQFPVMTTKIAKFIRPEKVA